MNKAVDSPNQAEGNVQDLYVLANDAAAYAIDILRKMPGSAEEQRHD